MQTKRNHNFSTMDEDEAARVRAAWKPVIEKLPDYAYLCDEISAKHKKMRRKTTLIYSEAGRKEIEARVRRFQGLYSRKQILGFCLV